MSKLRKALVWHPGLVWLFALLCRALPVSADSTWVFAVQLSAQVQESPPQIALNWEPDMYGATNYTVYRKSKEANDWGEAIPLSGSVSNYIDATVEVGQTYEYQVVKDATLG